MGHHTFDASKADRLERADLRYRYLSAEELCGALAAGRDDTVVDLGSGTGFYTDDVAPHADTVYAVDRQPAMQDYYRTKGVPSNVEPVTASITDLPFATNAVDAAVSTMTYHEFASEAALAEVRRVLAAGGHLVVVDWAATGTGKDGPSLDERYRCEEAVATLEAAAFDVERAAVRPETFVVLGTATG